jgi:hypothetical protein
VLRGLGFALVAASLAFACREERAAPVQSSTPSTPVPPASVASARPVTRSPPNAIDKLFLSYEAKLPNPATLSEGNGASLRCPRHGGVTYTLLEATAKKIPLSSDADLPLLVPWARHEDACLRQIALEALLPKIGYDGNKLSVPPMHEPEHYLYHDVFVSLKSHLDAKHVAYDPAIFGGMMLSLTAKDFVPTLRGDWIEKIGKSNNFQRSVKVDEHRIVVTTKTTHPNPDWPDRTETFEIADVRVNDRFQFVVTGKRSFATTAGRDGGFERVPPSRTYSFWPVSKDVMWFDAFSPGSWDEFLRNVE